MIVFFSFVLAFQKPILSRNSKLPVPRVGRKSTSSTLKSVLALKCTIDTNDLSKGFLAYRRDKLFWSTWVSLWTTIDYQGKPMSPSCPSFGVSLQVEKLNPLFLPGKSPSSRGFFKLCLVIYYLIDGFPGMF